MFLINAHPTRGRLLEYGRLIERGVYKIITGKRGAFIGDGRLKERGRLLEKIRYFCLYNRIDNLFSFLKIYNYVVKK